MQTVIINGSIQENNGSAINSQLIQQEAGNTSEVVSIEPFSDLFTGEYIYFSNANDEQRSVMEKIRDADTLIFVVPTYFKSLPGALKNFFDIVREKSLYEHKAIAFLASNHKNQDFGARHAREIIEGIIEFFETEAVFVSEIAISDPARPDHSALAKTIHNASQLSKHYQSGIQ